MTERPLPGDFGLAAGKGLAMAIVRWGTGIPRIKGGRLIRRPAKYGHAAMCVGWDSRADQPLIIEATPGGVVRRNVSVSHFDWSTGGPISKQYGLDQADRDKAVGGMMALLGRDYDWPNIGRFVAAWAWPGFPGVEDKDNQKVICSEAVVWALRGAGVSILGTTPAGRISPNDLAPFLPR